MSDFTCHRCGACCVVLPIDEPYPNHPNGKAAGERCTNLTAENLCAIYEQRPVSCAGFPASIGNCGTNRAEATVALTVALRVHQALA